MTPQAGRPDPRPGGPEGGDATAVTARRELTEIAELATGRIPAVRDDWTTPIYPTQRGRETRRRGGRATSATPSSAVTPSSAITAALPTPGVGDAPGPGDRTAPLPRTGDEPLGARPARPEAAAGGSGEGAGERGRDAEQPEHAADRPEEAADREDGDPIDEPDTPEDAYSEPDADTAAGWELVRATQAGDAEAFGALFDRYHGIVFRFVLYRLGDRPLAEDLTQETFVRAYRRIASVSYQGRDIGAWFVTIARNLVLDHVKSGRYRLESTIGEVTEVVPDRGRPGPEVEVVAGLVHAELLRCVQRLGDDQRECIDLRFLRGLSVSETAAAMDRNEGAVKALQHRAVRRLAQLLPEGLQ